MVDMQPADQLRRRSQRRGRYLNAPTRPASKAQIEALAIPELFELILSFLPTRDLLLVQRISKSFRDTIANSTRLQQLLFFKQRPLRTATVARPLGRQDFTVNDLLASILPAWYQPANLQPGDVIGSQDAFTLSVGQMNSVKQQAFLRKEASWRQMLPISPSPRLLEIVGAATFASDVDVRRTWLEFDGQRGMADGLRMGILYDLPEFQQGALSPLKANRMGKLVWHLYWHLLPPYDQPSKTSLIELDGPCAILVLTFFGGHGGKKLQQRYRSQAAQDYEGYRWPELDWKERFAGSFGETMPRYRTDIDI